MYRLLLAAPLLLAAHARTLSADPDPKQLLQDCQAALRTVKGASYNAKVEPFGAATDQLPNLDARVVLAKGDDPAAVGPLNGKFSVQGKATAPAASATDGQAPAMMEVYLTYDGTKVQFLNSEEKKVLEADLNEGGDELLGAGPGTFAVVQEFLVNEPLKDELSAPTITYSGAAEAAGVPCQTVSVDFGDPAKPNTKWFIADADHLPRRIDHTLSMPQGTGGVGITLFTLKTDVQPEPAAFTIKPPEGFEVQAYTNPDRPPMLKAGAEAPAWTLKDADGKDHSLADYKGKTVVLDFWASWCAPCKRAMPDIQKLHEHYQGQPVAVIGLDCREKNEEATKKAVKYFGDQGFTYGLLVDADKAADDYHVTGIPAIYVIGPDGKILMRTVGYDPSLEQKIATLIDAQLKGKDAAVPEPK